MTKPKPKALGSSIAVPEGAQVRRPGRSEADTITVVGGVYVFDTLGTHVIDGTEHEVVTEAQSTP